MKVNKTSDRPSRSDGSKFPVVIEKDDLVFHKVIGGKKTALYSALDKAKNKLKGFYLQPGMVKVNMRKINLDETFKEELREKKQSAS
jgi:hypothetical protein